MCSRKEHVCTLGRCLCRKTETRAHALVVLVGWFVCLAACQIMYVHPICVCLHSCRQSFRKRRYVCGSRLWRALNPTEMYWQALMCNCELVCARIRRYVHAFTSSIYRASIDVQRVSPATDSQRGIFQPREKRIFHVRRYALGSLQWYVGVARHS